MEISKMANGSLRLKGKTAQFVINPSSVSDEFHGAFYLQLGTSKNPLFGTGIAIDGPGEFEIGGIKIKGTVKDELMIYTIDLDGISVILGNLTALEKMQGKFQDLAVACVYVDSQTDPSFMSGFAKNYILYFGERAEELSQTFLKSETEKNPKLTTTKDKLPEEMQTILLA